jgi:hypothetical protein
MHSRRTKVRKSLLTTSNLMVDKFTTEAQYAVTQPLIDCLFETDAITIGDCFEGNRSEGVIQACS